MKEQKTKRNRNVLDDDLSLPSPKRHKSNIEINIQDYGMLT